MASKIAWFQQCQFFIFDTFIFWNHARCNQLCLLDPATTKTSMNFRKKKTWTLSRSFNTCVSQSVVMSFALAFTRRWARALSYPPLQFLRYLHNVKSYDFKVCIASNEYLSHIWGKFGGHSSIGDVRVTSQSYIVSRNHAFSDVT